MERINYKETLDKTPKLLYNGRCVVGFCGKIRVFSAKIARTAPLTANRSQIILEDFTMFEKLKELLVDELQIDEADITLDAELSGDLGINSIELADLVMLCEEKFDIEIDDENLHKLVTVGDVVSYLESL